MEFRYNQENSLLTGVHRLSLTSSGNTKNWLNEQAQWLALRDVFDHYLKMAFSMASDDHVHFSPINERSPKRFIGENLEQVRSAARLVASKAAADAHRRSEERRVGKEGVSKCRSRGSTYH